MTQVHAAVEAGDLRRVKAVVDRVALATSRDSSGFAPIHKAVIFKRHAILRYLIGKFPDEINDPDDVSAI